MWLIAGLGNPGAEYEMSRHNMGFLVADELARRWELSRWRAKFGGELAEKQTALLFKPQEFMNLSGQAVQRAMAFYKMAVTDLVVIHDEIDLPFGRVRVKVGGGHGGHNGVRSVIEHCGADFIRVRCGVDKPVRGKEQVVGHVLSPFRKEEQKELPFLIGEAADAVELVLARGTTVAMNRVNTERPRS